MCTLCIAQSIVPKVVVGPHQQPSLKHKSVVLDTPGFVSIGYVRFNNLRTGILNR